MMATSRTTEAKTQEPSSVSDELPDVDDAIHTLQPFADWIPILIRPILPARQIDGEAISVSMGD